MPVKELIEPKRAERTLAKETPVKSDRALLQGCLKNREEDWNLLIDKYKNLIFSIPLRYGFSREEAADIFQAVCLDLIQELPKLRDLKALPKWLMQVTAHKCFHRKRQNSRLASQDDEESAISEMSVPAEAEINLHEIEEEQILREAIAGLSTRCRELIHMLFYEEPKRPYQQVAAILGLATGSIGLQRQKCLDCLKKRLEDVGFV
jgi:RNA polymerase sigma factor (sigma-70 family)